MTTFANVPFLIIATTSLLLLAWLWFIIAKPQCWSHFVDRENSFWLKRGIYTPKFAERCSRFSNGVWLKTIIAIEAIFGVAALMYIFLICPQRDSPKNLRSDSALGTRLVGTWTMNETNQPRGLALFSNDGQFFSAWTNPLVKPIKAWSYDGRWKITNGTCFLTVLKEGTWNASASKMDFQSVCRMENWKIISLEQTQLVWKLHDQTAYLTRKE